MHVHESRGAPRDRRAGSRSACASERARRGSVDGDDARIQALVDERNAAKQARDFIRADAIRRQLAGEGVLLEDTAQGVRWRRG